MSKGSAQRPYDQKTFESNWEAIFGNRKTKNVENEYDNVGEKGEEDKTVPNDSDRG